MSWHRWLTFVLVFCMDVHVKAAEVFSGRQVIKAKSFVASMDSNSLLQQRDEKNVQLVRGQMYVETSQPVTFNTPYARVWCEQSCKGIFTREITQLNVRSLAGQWKVARTGDQDLYVIPEGMQMLFGEVSSDGAAAMEFPQSLPWDATVKLWASLYPGKMKELKPQIVEFRQVWKKAVNQASSMHEVQAQRTIASYEKEISEARARAAAQEREDARLRAIFRDKNP